MKKVLSLVAAAAAASLVLAGCAGGGDAPAEESESAPQETQHVSVAVLGPGALQWLHAIAEDQGFYTDENVEVEAIQVQNSAALVQAVASGSANAGIALGDNVIKAVDEGAPVTITGALIQKAALRLFGGEGVNSVSDLAGKAVTAGATQGGTFDLLLYMLQQEGVSTADLTPVAIPNSSDRVVALQNGQVSGALLIPPFDSVAMGNGATELGWYPEYWLETPSIVNTDWAAENPDAARGFTQGLAQAAKYFADPANKDSVIQILQDYSGVDEAAAADAYDFIHSNEVFSPDLSFPEEALSNVARISAEVNGEDFSGFDASKYMDMSYLKG